MAELIIQSGKLQGKRLVLPDKEVCIGRDDDCHVRLNSTLVSRRHCTLKNSPEGLWIHDLASQNGTYVNDVQVTEPVLLQPGDVLRVGATLFQVPVQKPLAGPETGSKGGRISDADIASWLSDVKDEKRPAKTSDTTIIKHAPAPSTQMELAASAAPPPAPAPAAPAPVAAIHDPIRRPLRTVKEQAAEIIRRHWVEVRGESPPG